MQSAPLDLVWSYGFRIFGLFQVLSWIPRDLRHQGASACLLELCFCWSISNFHSRRIRAFLSWFKPYADHISTFDWPQQKPEASRCTISLFCFHFRWKIPNRRGTEAGNAGWGIGLVYLIKIHEAGHNWIHGLCLFSQSVTLCFRKSNGSIRKSFHGWIMNVSKADKKWRDH